jgi:uncharacterized protein DUF6923
MKRPVVPTPIRPSARALAIAFLLTGDLVFGARMSCAEALWGSSSKGGVHPSSIFTIDTATGLATLVGGTGLGDGISAIRFDPLTGMLYGMLGSACTGAHLITIDTTTGAGTLVGTVVGAGFDGGSPVPCGGGSDALAFAPDGTLYAEGFSATAFAKLLKVDKTTGAVLEAHSVPDHLAGLAFDPSGFLWASHGNSTSGCEIHTIDPATGSYTSALTLSECVVISDLAFTAEGTMFASLPSENKLATIDAASGLVTRIGSFGAAVGRISGLAALPPNPELTALEPARLFVGLKNSNDRGAAFDLEVELARNGEPMASGLARCVVGLSRDPAPVSVNFDPFSPVSAKSGDVFSLKVSARMGTNPDDSRCAAPGQTHTSAVGLRLHYDSADHDSRFGATITPDSSASFFLHSDGGSCSTPGDPSAGVTQRYLDNTAPAAASDRCKDSASGNPGGQNPWKEIGVWSLTRP